MLSLVAYDSSDESDAENLETPKELGDSPTVPASIKSPETLTDNVKKLPNQVSLDSLPVPKYHGLEANLGSRKVNERVKIAIPSLSEFDDDEEDADEPKKKKIKPSQTGSGLIGILPPPAASQSFQLTPRQAIAKPKLQPNKESKNEPVSTAQSMLITSKSISGDNDDDVKIGSDFFSFANTTSGDTVKEEVLVPKVNNPPVMEEYGENNYTCYDQTGQQYAMEYMYEAPLPETSVPYVAPSSHVPLELDMEAMEKLCGRRNRNQIPENIQVLDLNEEAILSESRLLLAKQLTEDTTYRGNRKKNDGPSTMQRRKHQITYLAYEAKEREMQLKDQWATNRLSKRQTQSKYGF